MNSPFSNSNKYATAYVCWTQTDEPRTQRKPALSRIINPRQTAGPAYTANTQQAVGPPKAPPIAQPPTATRQTERRTCRTYVRWARGPWVT